jgi:hypothetical protein
MRKLLAISVHAVARYERDFGYRLALADDVEPDAGDSYGKF